jgi:glycosyltransferase involved in cell wall biosynthesis
MTVHIIYDNYLKPDGSEMSIGGIQTYIYELQKIIRNLGLDINIHQRSDVSFEKMVDGCKVSGYPLKIDRGMRKRLIARALQNIDQSRDLVIFGCETNAVEKLSCKTIGIQHGIFWDKPGNAKESKIGDAKIFLKKAIKAYQTVSRIRNLDTLVCVDYNFVNWYRAIVDFPRVHLIVNPNFCKVPSEKFVKPDDQLNIIFARRFFPYRGTRVFATAIQRICAEYPNVHVTIAGSGPDENYLRNMLKGRQYEFIQYCSSESLSIHRDKHIAVIPTLGSEGTSLSLLESMAAGCAPICTNVGGMTNIILDHFNGLMISPNEQQLYQAIKELVVDEKLRNRLASEAYRTANEAFNYNNWRAKWVQILNEFLR